MTDAEQREAARQFANKWKDGGDEKQDCHPYWIELLQDVLGVAHVTNYIDFEKPVKLPEGDGKIHTRYIDGYIADVKVLIEQKGSVHQLDEKEPQSGGEMLTPYEQAKRYNDNLPFDEKARWIVTCNFKEIWIYDMNARVPEPDKIALPELPNKVPMLNFLVKHDVKQISHEMQVSIAAGELVGKIYDAFAKQFGIPDKVPKNEAPEQKAQREADLKSLNALCVRLVFCFYAEDAGIFERASFHDYLASFEPSRLREALKNLFKILDTPVNARDRFLTDDLAAFPYINGGLFADESVEIPPITDALKTLLVVDASENFDWRAISPTIFGAVFESTLNPETRRKGGMHYTSIENIHKVIDPLFLDDLKAELTDILAIPGKRKRENALKAYQDKLASLTFLDPACGSGNFLTETYLSLRQLENRVITSLSGGQVVMGEAFDPIKVKINQFYGIEVNDFAVTVAKTALWIAESQMMQVTQAIIHQELDFLPLTTNANIVEGNALRIEWQSVVTAEKLNYIMGNPPFVGARLMSKEQKADIVDIFGKIKNVGNLDYVSGWYKKASDMMQNNAIRAALVSTNSVSQGETVANLWEPLFADGVHIDFAYRTFRWDSEASDKAHVHCVIIGFSTAKNDKPKVIYTDDQKETVGHINAYLIDGEDIFVERRTKPICDEPELLTGSQRIDNNEYIFTKEEKDHFIQDEPLSRNYFHRWYGAEEYINNKERWCLWLGNCEPHELRKMPKVLELVKHVKEYREKSKRTATRRAADNPTHFGLEVIPDSNFIIIPVVSSERRRYIPMGIMQPKVICSNQVNLIPNATIYHFGILTSNVHMAWVRTVCGRLKSDYRYSKNIVYNNFPWPSPTDAQKAKIEKTAQAILDVRADFPDSSLADLYDPLTMPPKLLKAHQQNDRAVMAAYGFTTKMSEADCVAALMKLYQGMTKK